MALQEVQMPMASAGVLPEPPAWVSSLNGYAFQTQPFAQAEWDHQLDRNLRVLSRGAVTANATVWRENVFALEAVDNTSRALIISLRHRASGELFSVANVV